MQPGNIPAPPRGSLRRFRGAERDGLRQRAAFLRSNPRLPCRRWRRLQSDDRQFTTQDFTTEDAAGTETLLAVGQRALAPC